MQGKLIKIISTKDLNPEVISHALKYKITIDCHAFIDIQFVRDANIDSQISKLSTQKANIIFTSANAVKALEKLLSNVPDWNIYCLEGATSTAVKNLFGEEKIMTTAKDAASLGMKIKDSESPFYLLAGDKRLDTVPDIFRSKGRKLEEIILYRNIQMSHVVNGHYDGILFFSPSAAESYFQNNAVTDEILFAFGSTTYAALQTLTNKHIVLNDHHSQHGMVDTVIKYFKHE